MTDIFSELFTLPTFLALVFGTVGGLIIGALPGLSATMGIALLIPFSYTLDTVPAMIMLVSIYCSAVYGGSFSAILIRTPGTPASAATSIDGYPLTLQGKGRQALGVSTTASCIGGIISGVALLFIAPQLVKVALLFSAPEYFLVTLFGLTIVGSLSGDDFLKGILSAVFGLLIGCIGMNATPYARYSFGNVNLMGGIYLVPAMIGLFSIPQVITLAQSRVTARNRDEAMAQAAELKRMIRNAVQQKGRFWPDWKTMKTILPAITTASLYGLLVGIMPGAGGDIGSWFGYNCARNLSKHKELFGKGALDGIAGSEAGNNAVCGGALIPALTLGIPGSGAAAVILGALMLQGFAPGTALFTTYADMTYALFIGFIAANILMGVAGWAFSRYAVKFAAMPNGILIPVIISLSIIGSFSMRNNLFDVLVMLVFGIIGHFMKKCGVPAAPAVLGLILGPMCERNLINSFQMAKSSIVVYFISRPLCDVLIMAIVATVAVPIVKNSLKRKKGRKNGRGSA
ncbi:MAG: tripartite tricarboxylate transporter permease [Oscillospiraceae bacterium]